LIQATGWIKADRAALHEALRESEVDIATGRLFDAAQILKEIARS